MSIQTTIRSVIQNWGSAITINHQTSSKNYGEYTWTTQSSVNSTAVSSRNNVISRLINIGGDFNNSNVRIIFKDTDSIVPTDNSDRYLVTWQGNEYLINDVNKIVLQDETIAQIADLVTID